MEDKSQEMPIPQTVGKMIEFLKKFPKDRRLDIYYVEYGDYGYENPVYHMKFHELKDYGSVEITFK